MGERLLPELWPLHRGAAVIFWALSFVAIGVGVLLVIVGLSRG